MSEFGWWTSLCGGGGSVLLYWKVIYSGIVSSGPYRIISISLIPLGVQDFALFFFVHLALSNPPIPQIPFERF
jgi:hypothetical protein